jgi:inosine-uridine nucleoside N-ribohydrolase
MSGPVLVDNDSGIDDAPALHRLVATGRWDLKAITAVAGNVPLTRAVANTRSLAALLGIERDVPVQALREKSPGSDPQLGLGQARLVREDFAGHFVATLDAQASLQ